MHSGSRKRRKIFFLFVVISVTTITLVVETYAWFIGTAPANVSQFTVGVASEDGLQISLNGTTWSNTITLNTSDIGGTTVSYANNTNIYPATGLKPLSTDGAINSTVSRLIFYEKTSLSSTAGGFRIIADSLDMTTTTEKDGYIAFDLFVKNGSGDSYAGGTVNSAADEDVYLTPASTITGRVTGTPNGVENSVRVGFFELARVKTQIFTADQSTYVGMNCSSNTANVTTLCSTSANLATNMGSTWNIWEPNDLAHTSALQSYFSAICKKRTASGYTTEACSALSTSATTTTYAVNSAITSADAVDIYDGLNTFTSNKLTAMSYYKDADFGSGSHNNNKVSLIKLAGNSVTKVRIYVWLEGQDVDNYDQILGDDGLNIQFGLTKDKFNIGT